MNWNTAIDQCLLMTIKELVEILSFEAIRDNIPSTDDLLNGSAASVSDKLARHQRSILEVIEKGCLLGQVQILRGDKQSLHNLCELRRERANLRNRSGRIAFYRTLDPGLPPDPAPPSALDTFQLNWSEFTLVNVVNELEVCPGDVVRWMNSVHEGQALLPTSLRRYILIAAVPPPTDTHQEAAKNVPGPTQDTPLPDDSSQPAPVASEEQEAAPAATAQTTTYRHGSTPIKVEVPASLLQGRTPEIVFADVAAYTDAAGPLPKPIIAKVLTDYYSGKDVKTAIGALLTDSINAKTQRNATEKALEEYKNSNYEYIILQNS